MPRLVAEVSESPSVKAFLLRCSELPNRSFQCDMVYVRLVAVQCCLVGGLVSLQVDVFTDVPVPRRLTTDGDGPINECPTDFF